MQWELQELSCAAASISHSNLASLSWLQSCRASSLKQMARSYAALCIQGPQLTMSAVVSLIQVGNYSSGLSIALFLAALQHGTFQYCA